MSRQPRKCIFCGANASSAEHIWPTWLHHLLGKPSTTARHDRLLYSFHPSTGERISGVRGRQGDQRTIRIRAVCRPCNSGWMNRLEAKARPFLKPIVRADPTTLDHDAIEAVARWVALKSIVAEHAMPDVSLTPLADREALKDHGTIPPYFRIYVAHNIGTDRLFFRRHSHCIGWSLDGPDPPLEGTTKNIQATTLVVGRAAIQVVATRVANFALEDKAQVVGFHDRCQLWPPLRAAMTFPSRPRLDAAGVRYISTFFERYLAATKAVWQD